MSNKYGVYICKGCGIGGHAVAGAGADRVEEGCLAALRRHHDERSFPGHGLEPAHDIEGTHARLSLIHEQDVDVLPPHAFESLVRSRREDKLLFPPGENSRERAAACLIVFDDEDLMLRPCW